MRKSVLAPCEELSQQLLEVGDLVDQFQEKKPMVLENWLQWLVKSEETLRKYNYVESAELAGLRANILATETKANQSRKKTQTQTALGTVDMAQGIMIQRQRILEEKIESVRGVLRQIVIAAKQAEMINFRPGQNFTAFLESFLSQMQKHEQLSGSINSAIASVGRFDVIRILAEEIELS